LDLKLRDWFIDLFGRAGYDGPRNTIQSVTIDKDWQAEIIYIDAAGKLTVQLFDLSGEF